MLDVLRKIKDLLGLGPCNRLKAVGNLLWHHQIHDQPLIWQRLKGVWKGRCFRVIIFKSGLKEDLKCSTSNLSAVVQTDCKTRKKDVVSCMTALAC